MEDAACYVAGADVLLLVVEGEREEILPGLRRAARHGGAQHGRPAIRRHDGAIGLPGNLAGLQDEAAAAPHHFLAEYLEHFLSSFFRTSSRRRARWPRRRPNPAATPHGVG